MTIEIRPLTPERQADFLAYFEGDAFADNPRWAFCYCQFLHVDPSRVVWKDRSAAENRAAACERIDSGDVPAAFKGTPIALVTAGLMALAFMGFSGLGGS